MKLVSLQTLLQSLIELRGLSQSIPSDMSIESEIEKMTALTLTSTTV